MAEKTVFEEIVTELVEVAKKLEEESLKDIFKKYKKGNEEELRDNLLDWNIEYNSDDEDLEDEGDEPKKGKKKKKKKDPPNFWFRVGNKNFPLWLVYSISREEEYDFVNGRQVFKIVLNEGIETKSSIIRDVDIKFSTELERDEEFNALQTRLAQFNIVFL